MSNPIVSFFQKIFHWFSSPQGQAIAHAIEQAAIDAQPLVQAISLLVPSRTFASISAAYGKYAVPFAMTELQLSDPSQQGLALRDLATAVLRKNHQDASANVLNAAVELALAHAKTA
jgi:hypothetical protein